MMTLSAQSPGANIVRLAGRRPLVLRADRLIDGTGAVPIKDGAVLIEARRLSYVGAAAGLPRAAGAEEMHYPGATILPGLIDAHLHLTGDTTDDVYRRFLTPSKELRVIKAGLDAATMLAAGFTTVRDI